MAAAVAYVRRSRSGEEGVSIEAQKATVQQLAAANGHQLARIYQETGVSGGSESRPQYLAMLAQAEAGNVQAIYAYDQDRLARSNYLFALLLRLADQHGFSVVTPAGDLTDEDRRDFAEMRGLMDGGELRKMTKRNRANHARQVRLGYDRGDTPLGYAKQRACDMPQPCGKNCPHPYTGDLRNAKGQPVAAGAVVNVLVDEPAITTVLNAYHAAGSALGAAQLLNAAGVPTKRGRTWNNRGVREVVEREAPQLLPAKMGRGRPRHYRVRVLSGLLRCHCGQVLSPLRDSWLCRRGKEGVHGGRYVVASSRVLPWAQQEAARLRVPDPAVLVATGGTYDDSAEREQLAQLRDAIGEDAYGAAVAALDAKRDAAQERVLAQQQLPQAVDWQAPDDVVNGVLRALWAYVQLDEEMQPVRAEWQDPTLRR